MSLIATALALATPPVSAASTLSAAQMSITAKLLLAQPGEATCGGSAVRPAHAERPVPAPVFGDAPEASVTLRFRIDGDGRPLGIAFEGDAPPGGRSHLVDLQPALAAWRFEAGQARAECRVTFALQAVDVDSASEFDAFRYLALSAPNRIGYNASLIRQIFERARGPGSTCDRPLKPKRAYQPRAGAPALAPGGLSFAVVNYDIDVLGKPVDVRVIASDGHEMLERFGMEAVARSHYAEEAKRGCVHPFRRNAPAPLSAPPMPSFDALDLPRDGACRKDKPQWQRMPKTVFPDEFARRNVEGWAIVRYDVAPSGEVGDVTAVAAEPASAFGDRAVSVIRSARKAPSQNGTTGCIDRVLFRMPAGAAEPPAG